MTTSISVGPDQSESPPAAKRGIRIRRVEPPMSAEQRLVFEDEQKRAALKCAKAEAELVAELQRVGLQPSDLDPDEWDARVWALMYPPPGPEAQAALDAQFAKAALMERAKNEQITLCRESEERNGDSTQRVADAATEESRVSASTIEPERTLIEAPIANTVPETILGDYVRINRLNRVCGLTGVGKTLLCLELGARVSTGTQILDFAPHRPSNVLYLTAPEDGMATHEARLQVADGDRARIVLVDVKELEHGAEHWLRSAPPGSDTDLLRDFVRRNNIKLIVLNPAYTFVKHGTLSEIDADLDNWARLADEEKVTVIAVDYEGAYQPGLAALTTRLRIKARASLLIEEVEGGAVDERILRLAKCNDVAAAVKQMAIRFRIADVEGIPKIEWVDRVPVGHRSRLEPARRGPRPEKELAAAEFLRELLGLGRVRSFEGLAAAKKAGHAKATVYRAMGAAGVVSEPVDYGPGRWWRL